MTLASPGTDAASRPRDQPGPPLLSIQDLVVQFRTQDGTIHAVNGVSFDLEPGETLGLVGKSGCGKSVTSLATIRLLPQPAGHIEGGKVIFDGIDLGTLSERDMRDLRGREIAMIFQDPMTSLNPVLTIEEQLVETIQAHKKVEDAEARRRAIDLLAMVGIPEPEGRLKSYPHQFSGGMRQRVMIAMALALEPRLMIADEPTTALDVTIQAQVLEILRRLTEESGTAMILITHDLGVVAGMTQRINVMYAGLIVEAATTHELFRQPVASVHDRIAALDPAHGHRGTGRDADPDRRGTAGPASSRHGLPVRPRCAWRLPVCWTENPGLLSTGPGARVVMTGPGATHRIACHNPPTTGRSRRGASAPRRVRGRAAAGGWRRPPGRVRRFGGPRRG